ncbi:hypothetical protein MD484_g7615, partial [Candolleomyces efflorescens]
MSPAVESGQDLLIPSLDPEAAKPYCIHWKQSLGSRKADYYCVTARNITLGTQFLFFIAAEFYMTSTQDDPKHITKVGQLLPGEGYKIKVDSELQYGQKDSAEEVRFVVYHDKNRLPYQHRFIEIAIGVGAAQAQALATHFGYLGLQEAHSDGYLHTF